ncbi:hypothetical protein [Pedobacter deserti]|uniref:hypothetical protein n=1 Tax=Pedobacter deserti TaxID=2817382 RepID=UPI00210D0D60|nr:hypothetical protein [Pedobacter sp. SYSU D00382]
MHGLFTKKIHLPPLLWKLHGRSACVTDLLMTYSFAILVGIVNLYFSRDLPVWASVIILALSLDIGGGVISNLTRGTIDYYRQSNHSPYAFIWVHLIQAALLAWVYQELMDQIMMLSLIIMTLSSELIRVSGTERQKPLSTFLFGLVLLATLVLEMSALPVRLLLILLAFKLIMGFAGHSKSLHKE